MSGLGDLLVGSLLGALGILALLLSVLRFRHVDRLLAAFGVFTLLYGARLVFGSSLAPALGIEPSAMAWVTQTITYVINVPAWVFFYEFFGRGRRSIVLWWLGVVTAFATVGVLSDIVQRTPGTLTRHPNNILVIAGLLVIVATLLEHWQRLTTELRILIGGLSIFGLLSLNDNLVSMGLLPWTWREESIGFLFFVGSLGWIAARRFFGKERQLAALEGELATAREIQRSLLPSRPPSGASLSIAVRFLPTSAVAGDLYEFPPVQPPGFAALVADVSGHGVPAALIASMLKAAVASHPEVADRPQELFSRVNRTLCDSLRRGFVTAAYARADLEREEWVVASAGHPPPLLSRAGSDRVDEVGGRGPLLARFRAARYAEERLPLRAGDRLVLYTDGAVEARSPEAELFGEDRLCATLAAGRRLSPDELCDALLAELESWTGSRQGLALDDDLTLLVIDVQPAVQRQGPPAL